MIDLKNNFVFIHIGNSAGTSVEKSFSHGETYHSPFGLEPVGAHYTYWQKEKWCLENLEKLKNEKVDFESMFKFTIVRNPWDRMVSKYMHESQNLQVFNEQVSKGLKGGPDFKSFLMYLEKFEIGKLKNSMNNEPADLNDYRHISPSLDWFPPEKMDKIIIFDNLHEGFNEVAQKLNLNTKLEDLHPGLFEGTWKKPDRKLDSFGKPRKHYSCYYDDECVDFVRKRFKKDIDYFNFVFEDKR